MSLVIYLRRYFTGLLISSEDANVVFRWNSQAAAYCAPWDLHNFHFFVPILSILGQYKLARNLSSSLNAKGNQRVQGECCFNLRTVCQYFPTHGHRRHCSANIAAVIHQSTCSPVENSSYLLKSISWTLDKEEKV